MKLQSKICGVKDIKTLNYIINHKYPPNFIGMIVNYKKSHRFIENKKAKKLTNIKKNNINYVAVLVAPTIKDLEKIKNLNFQYYQIYDQSPNQIKKIKKKYKKKIILALTIESIDDVLKYKKYENIADIILFDSKGYEKSKAYNHKLLLKIPKRINKMVAGNIKIDQLEKIRKIADIVDVSGSLETNKVKDLNKIENFLLKIKEINEKN